MHLAEEETQKTWRHFHNFWSTFCTQ